MPDILPLLNLPFAKISAAVSSYYHLILISIVTGVLCSLAYEQISPQRQIMAAKNKLSRLLLEGLLFKDSLLDILTIQLKLLKTTAVYLLLGLGPALLIAIPMGMLYFNLSVKFHSGVTTPGSDTSLRISYRPEELNTHSQSLSTLNLMVDSPVLTVSGPVQINTNQNHSRTAAWGLKASSIGNYKLKLQNADHQTLLEIPLTISPTADINNEFLRQNLHRDSYFLGNLVQTSRSSFLCPGYQILPRGIQGISLSYADTVSLMNFDLVFLLISLLSGLLVFKLRGTAI